MLRAPPLRARPTLWQHLDALGRRLFPLVCAASFQLVLAAPLGLPGQQALRPALALVCVYFWTLYRPQSMTPLAAFLLGLLVDVLGSGPIGVTVVALLAVQGITHGWRWVLLRREGFAVFCAFCGLALLFAAILWALSSLFSFTLLPLDPVLFQSAVAAGCYPVMALFLFLAHRGVADPEQA